jgi:predicted hydrolase (HD superfamily)
MGHQSKPERDCHPIKQRFVEASFAAGRNRATFGKILKYAL